MARTSQIRKQAKTPAPKTQASTLTKRPVMLDYPGLGLPLRHNKQDDYGFYPIGAHGSCYGSDSDMIPVRELAMMDIMEKLTDKENWHKKVFDNEIVVRWRKEALALPDEEFWKLATDGKRQYWDHDNDGQLRIDPDDHEWIKTPEGIMSETTFDCCVEELRSKARYFEETGIIPTLDACASVAKSDRLVSAALHESLRNAFDKLKIDHEVSPDWHPNSNDMVQDLVHPSMYPLVYGRSRGFKEECVGVVNAIEHWAGKGEVIPKDDWKYDHERDRFRYGVGAGDVPPNYWSETYQWLPANVAFKEDGSVKFTSYINNLHPMRYPDIYRTIEDLVKTSLPLWDQCLAMATGYEERDGAGRTEPRFSKPDNPDDENEENWIPRNAEECADAEFSKEQLAEQGYNSNYDEDDLKRFKWESIRRPCIPEPSFKDVDYAPEEGKRLFDRFRDSGLQIIVKMASIELTPEKANFPVGGWHVEGQMNEHICATALYYLDSENITNSSLSFRMQTSAYMNDDKGYDVGQDAYHWMEQIYGTSLGVGNSPCLQNYGSVETRQGRLLAFPNVFQHRVSPFRLIDPTKPGHRRFIALWLVDPTKRIISTANIPPQQMTWYVDSLLGSKPTARTEALSKLPPELVALLAQHGVSGAESTETGKLPAELMDMVKQYFEEGKEALPMSVEEAREHRAKLMKERSAFQETAESGWQEHSYSFCEH
ncbi:Nn.00g003490.m01.CDS01 [Neocucurbitaria sp. VM-36]